MSFEGREEILGEFVVESQEQLDGVEAELMDMEVRRVAGEAIDPGRVDAIFRAFHSVKGTAGFLDLDAVVAVTHEAESLLDLVRKGELELESCHVTALCAALDFTAAALQEVESTGSDAALAEQAEDTVQFIAEAVSQPCSEAVRPLDQDSTPAVLFPLDAVEEQSTCLVEPSLSEPSRSDEVDATEAEPDGEPSPVESPAPEASAGPVAPPAPVADAPNRPASRGSIRVDVEKLDALMNLVGELILAETLVTHSQDLAGLELPHFTKAARDLDRITRALQDVAMSVRMVPVGGVFQRMHRLVRDVSMKQGKQVQLLVSGEGTEIDKNLVERIGDPLVHMMRNAVDHGIESPEAREAAGKPAMGTVRLSAHHASGEVCIEIADDGKGLDRDRIAAKAVERGLIDSADGLTDAQVFELIFRAGFSTAEAVSDISGRGVGMDVVRRNIEAMSGRVEIASTLGQGTTLTLRIPLTLAIIDGMLVRIGSRVCTLPVLSIRQSIQGRAANVTRLPDGREVVNLRGEVLPLLRVGRIYGDSDELSVADGILVVCTHAGRTLALLVDALLGQRQTVIQALPAWLGERPGFSGCSILPDGDISLIMDLGALLCRTERPSTLPAATEACA